MDYLLERFWVIFWYISSLSTRSSGSMQPRCIHFGMVIRACVKPSLCRM